MTGATVAAFPARRWLLVAAFAALALLALERWLSGAGREGLPSAGTPPRHLLTGVPLDYDDAVARIDLTVEHAAARARSPQGWLEHDAAARAWLARSRLTGSFDEHQAAEAALTRAFAAAVPRTGPHLTGAVLALRMHRLSRAQAYLDAIDGYAVPPDRWTRAEIAAMRGDIAFYRGDYAAALDGYDAADAVVPGTADFRRAIYHSRTGAAERAEDYLGRAERGFTRPTPQVRAYYELQRGILDLERGRWDAALAHFRRADAAFPGYWLIEEHIAEVTALNGDLDAAEARYEDIVRRTGHPEFMDALAGIARQRGDDAAAAAWTSRAAQTWEKRLAQFPEAAYGHALDHCVDKGDWRCALALASRNHAARPYGDAKIALAQALLHNRRPFEAKAMIEAVLASPWRTAELHSVAAEIYEALGDRSRAVEQARLARAIDPHALDPA